MQTGSENLYASWNEIIGIAMVWITKYAPKIAASTYPELSNMQVNANSYNLGF